MSPGRIAVGYTVLAILWIAFSDSVVTWLDLHPAVMTVKGAVFVLVTAALLHVTIRRLVEAARRTSRERDETASLYRTVVETTSEGICLVDGSGTITFLNQRLATMLGRPAESLHGHRLQDFTFEPDVLAGRSGESSATHVCRLRNDSDADRERWVLMTRHAVPNDAAEIQQWMVTAFDITDRKRAEEALALRSFALDNALDAVFVIDEHGRFFYVNDECCRRLGFTREELLGMAVPDIDPDFGGRWSTHWSDLRAQGSLSIVSQHRTRDGRLIPVEISARYLEYGDRSFNLAIARDITERKRVEDELRQSRAHLEEAQRLSHTGSWHLDLVHDRLFWSDEVFRMFGLAMGTPLTYASFLSVVHADDRERVDAAWKSALRGAPYDVEHRIVVGSDVRWVRERAQVEFDADGSATRATGTVQDITERKRAEEALRERANLLNLTHDTVFVVDMSGVIKYWNRGAEEHYGWTAEQATGRVVHEMLATVFPSPLDEIKVEVARAGRWEGELVHTRKDGSQIVVASRWALQRDAHGAPVAILETNNDVTARKQAEETLRESETRFRTFVDHVGDALFVQDLELGTIVDVNRHACESLGYTREELIGSTAMIFHLDGYRAEMRLVEERAAAGEPMTDRHEHRRKDGTTFPVEAQTKLVSYGGRRFLLKVARDISDRVHAEENRERLRHLETELAHLNRLAMLGELTASLAHELNQPIAAAIANAGACLRWLAHEPPELEEARDAAKMIRSDGNRAAAIITRLREFYKKGAPPQRERVDVGEIAGEMMVLLAKEAKRHGVTMRTEGTAELPRVLADRVQMQQILMNLMLNAIEAMGETGGELTIRAQCIDDGTLEMSVSDTGVGLPASNRDQIFHAFFTTKPKGTGLGLKITRSLVEAHGGRLWATSNLERGATFHFTLPTT